MATISSYRKALAAPRSHFSVLGSIDSSDKQIICSTYFAEAKVERGGKSMLIYMPLAAVSLRRVERLLPLKRHLTSPIVPELTILRDEMFYEDAMGRTMRSDILCEPMPGGLPFTDALATIADYNEAEQLVNALDELQGLLRQANLSHNNIREENIVLSSDNHLRLIRWYYATDGVVGDDEAFSALRAKIISKSEGLTLHEPDFGLYQAPIALEGHLSVRMMCEGLAAVEHDSGWGFVDSDNNIVVEPKYVWVSDFREGRAEVQTLSGMGLIDRAGEYIIPPCYKIVDYDVVSGCSEVLGDDGWMSFDYEGFELKELEELEEYDESASSPVRECELC